MARTQKHTRREFLAGQAARDTATSLADPLDFGPFGTSGQQPPDGFSTVPDAPANSYQLRFSRRAMACQFEFILPAGQFERGSETALAALDLVEQLEEQLTAYRDTSELMAINRMAASGPAPVEPRLFGLLELAQRLNEQTAGAYDIATGALSKIWGFYRRQGTLPAADEIALALQHAGSRHVELDRTNMTVRFLTGGVELNLGSIGKGYALDRCGELFRAAGVDRVLLHGGQSSVLAISGPSTAPGNTRSTDEAAARDDASRIDEREVEAATDQPGWLVGIGDPLRPGRRLAVVRLNNQALGTSGSSVQYFRHGGKRYGHILDPRTGWPAERLLSATVIASSAAEADACSTAAYVLGLEGAIELCDEVGAAGVFIESPAAGTKHKITTYGLDADDFWLTEQNDSIPP